MHRIDTSTAAPNANGAGKAGFRPGASPGVAATRLNEDWFNAVQEECANVVEAGGFTLDKTDFYQLLRAVRMQGAKAALQLEVADETAGADLKGIARKPRVLSSRAVGQAVGAAGEIWRLAGGEASAVTVGSGYTDAFTDIVYDATLDLFLMCGENGEIQSSAASGAATRRDTGGSDTLKAIACDGAGKAVAVGAGGRIRYTSNGTAWSAGTDPFAAKIFDDVAFGAGLFVAVLGYSTGLGIATSPTGQTWTSRMTPSGTAIGAAQVVYHASVGFLAYSDISSGTVYHSADGITWTAIVSNASGGAGEKILFAGPYSWGIAGTVSGGTCVRLYFGTGANGVPYFDCDYVANVALHRLIVLDGQLWGLFEDIVYVGGQL